MRFEIPSEQISRQAKISHLNRAKSRRKDIRITLNLVIQKLFGRVNNGENNTTIEKGFKKAE